MNGNGLHKNDRDRGQAFTLEGLAAGVIVLTAVLFALQAVAVTPSSSGGADGQVRAKMQTEAEDVLTVVAENETFGLDAYIRYWDEDRQRFAGAINERIGYGSRTPPGEFGTLLQDSIRGQGRSYNIELRYPVKNGRTDSMGDLNNGTKTLSMVHRGRPPDSAVTATYTVTLYDNMTLTSPNASRAELWEYDTNATDGNDGYYPIPNMVDGPVYNVVEVRVTVW